MSLRARLSFGIGALLVVALGLFGVDIVRSTRHDLRDQAQRQVERNLGDRLQGGIPRPGQNQDSTDTRTLPTAHLVVDERGEIIVSEPSGPPANPDPLPVLDERDIERLRDGRAVEVEAEDGSFRYLALGGPRGPLLEVEAVPLRSVDRTMSALVNRLLVGAVVTLLLAVGAMMIGLRRGLRPLDEVVATADAVASGERERRIRTDHGPAEIRHLSTALDRMLQQQRAAVISLEQSEGRLRQFISDASHELQTPITSVLGWAELHRKGALDEAGTQSAMARIEAEGRRMTTLVDDLSLLARLDEHRPLHVERFDLVGVARDAVTDAAAIAADRPVELVAPRPVMVDGDAQRLRQVVDNLLRNVRAHTPAGTGACVDVRRDGSMVELRVIDEGPGLDPEHLEHVFDRFWRRDESRTRSTGGSGLGLAIVRALVEAHRGTVTAANRTDGHSGAAFTVRLPAAD